MNRQSINHISIINKPKGKKDDMLSKLINFGTVILFFGIAVGIYIIFFNKNKIISNFEGFDTQITNPLTTTPLTINSLSGYSNSNSNRGNSGNSNDTIYETSLKNIYGNNPRLICGMIPNPGNNICTVDGKPYVIYNFPIHMIKLSDASILAVFNDGRLYKKDDVSNTMWHGPLDNSLPNDSIPLRMITLATDLVTLLGVGYDNKLYMKQPDVNGYINLTAYWRPVPNNTDIIYVLFDNDTGFLISIDISGKLFIKVSSDLTSNNTELINRLDRPVLRLYYDLNGYMLAIDNNFDMYQFADINWKNSTLNLQRGANSSKLQDIMYDNDGRLFGLVFNPVSYMVQIMKQDQAFYLGNFIPLDQQINLTNSGEFVMSDQDIILSKTGNINTYLQAMEATDAADEDPNIAYQKQIMQTRANLLQFCANRNSTTSSNYDNYDLLASVEQNDDKIGQLKGIINNLISYEPDKARIQEKYPVIQS